MVLQSRSATAVGSSLAKLGGRGRSSGGSTQGCCDTFLFLERLVIHALEEQERHRDGLSYS
jgi:hypothetical protein